MATYITRLPDVIWQKKMPRTLAILGSTGSIGRSALEVVGKHPHIFHVAALAGARNISLLAKQANQFRPACLGVLEDSGATILRAQLDKGYYPEIVVGQEGYEHIAASKDSSTVLSAQVGAAGLRATMAAATAGKVIALANKESLVMAGDLIRAICAVSGASILPVDSEHNAIFQCLAEVFYGAPQRSGSVTGNTSVQSTAAGFGRGQAFETCFSQISRLILTASGGPFRGKTREELATVTVDSALTHPNWSMGAKISIDSATLMNKGLEVIEAHHLYGLPLSAIDVVVHKESIIHSLVEYSDGSQLAHLSNPDMRIAIAHCLGWPERLQADVPPLNLAKVGSLTFTEPDTATFPCLSLAKTALERGQGSPVVLNAANEEAVEAFLGGKLSFPGIAALVKCVLDEYAASLPVFTSSLENILELDAKARQWARELICTGSDEVASEKI